MMLGLLSQILLTPWYDWHHGGFSPLVAAWTFLGLVGAIFTAFNLKDAINDTDALAENAKSVSPRRKQELLMIAKAGIRSEGLRLIGMLAMIVSGVVAALTTPVLSDTERARLHIPYWTPASVIIITMLLSIVTVMVTNAYLDRRLRRRFYDGG